MKLTRAQQRVVNEMGAGQQLIRCFDVYGGYWWRLRPTGQRVLKSTVEALLASKVIVESTSKRIYSGYQEMPYLLAQEPPHE